MTTSAVIQMEFPSESSDARYTVNRYADGSWFCSCPAFRFQKGKPATERTCKHVKKVIDLASDDPELTIEV